MLAAAPVNDLILLALALVVAGAVTGVLAGLFGVGGGAVMVPILYQLFGYLGVPEEVRIHLCVGTSLAVIIPTSIRSFAGHRSKGAIDMAALRIWAVPVVLGVVAGAAFAAFAPSGALRGVFAVVAGLIAVKMLFGREDWRIAAQFPGRFAMWAYGLGVGVLSALMGIGGGVFGNLILTLHGAPIHRAVATSSGLGVLIAIPGALGYVLAGWPKLALLPPLSLGYVSLIGAALLIPTSVLFTPLGVRLAHGMSRRQLEIGFGLFLTFVSLRFLWTFLD